MFPYTRSLQYNIRYSSIQLKYLHWITFTPFHSLCPPIPRSQHPVKPRGMESERSLFPGRYKLATSVSRRDASMRADIDRLEMRPEPSHAHYDLFCLWRHYLSIKYSFKVTFWSVVRILNGLDLLFHVDKSNWVSTGFEHCIFLEKVMQKSKLLFENPKNTSITNSGLGNLLYSKNTFFLYSLL